MQKKKKKKEILRYSALWTSEEQWHVMKEKDGCDWIMLYHPRSYFNAAYKKRPC